MAHLYLIYLWNYIVISHSYVSLPEGNDWTINHRGSFYIIPNSTQFHKPQLGMVYCACHPLLSHYYPILIYIIPLISVLYQLYPIIVGVSHVTPVRTMACGLPNKHLLRMHIRQKTQWNKHPLLGARCTTIFIYFSMC